MGKRRRYSPYVQIFCGCEIWTTADDPWFNADVQLKAEAIFAERTGKENFVEYEFKQWKG